MEEIIATKRKYASKAPKFAIACGAVIIFLCILVAILYPVVLYRFTFWYDYEAWKLKLAFGGAIVLGIVLIAVGAFMLYRANRVPEVIIKYRDGILYFSDGFSCRIEEVDSVRCSPVCNHYGNCDTLIVVVNGERRTYSMIENVQRANDRLIELMLESRERTSVKLDYKNKGE